MNTLTARRIVTDFDVEWLRIVRNRTAWGFSNFTAQITPVQQALWWAEHKDRVQGWLYHDSEGALVGFGLIRQDDDGYWLTVVGVLPSHEGRGFGKKITADIVRKAPGRCRATARKDNPGAVKLHVSEDWAVTDGPNERLVYFESRYDPAGVLA